MLREHGLEQDFDQQLIACVDAMSQPDAVGQTMVFERPDGELRMRQVDTRQLLETPIDRYEMVLFDGVHTHGDRWKHLFFPAQRLHHFVHEIP
ncbi:hypothetical protein ABXK61_13060 [Burkholderia sola]|uniref:hypothetical protein n=1 Tax=Burkholderia sp. AcTa6-5 TaxID=2821361 RepID=UPI001AE7E94F|nr:hypothetical protein [Burkholderia sp. AcTa6-5]